MTGPFDHPERDRADEHAHNFAAAAGAAWRNARNRATTDAIWRDLVDVTSEQIEHGMLEFLEVPVLPVEEVTRWRRKALFFAREAPEKRAAFYAQLAALDDARVREALAAYLDAQARACMVGRGRTWLESEGAARASCALAALCSLPDWRAARDRLAEGVRARIVEIAGEMTRAA